MVRQIKYVHIIYLFLVSIPLFAIDYSLRRRINNSKLFLTFRISRHFFASLLFFGSTFQVVSADNSEIGLKEFMANPPPIRDYSVNIKSFDRPDYTNEYSYVRWQNGDFVSLQSLTNKQILEGITDESEGIPIGCGNYGDHFWFFEGNEKQVNVFEWGEARDSKPSYFRTRSIIPKLGDAYRLLTFGCLGVSPYSIHWNGNKAHISKPEIPAELELELEFDKEGKAKKLHYTYQNTDPKRKYPQAKWIFEYEYGNTNVPNKLPSKVSQFRTLGGKTCLIRIIETHRLTLADKAMTKEDFTPYLFLSSNANVQPGKIDGTNRIIKVNGEWQTIRPTKSNPSNSKLSKYDTKIIGVLLIVAVFIFTGIIFKVSVKK